MPSNRLVISTVAYNIQSFSIVSTETNLFDFIALYLTNTLKLLYSLTFPNKPLQDFNLCDSFADISQFEGNYRYTSHVPLMEVFSVHIGREWSASNCRDNHSCMLCEHYDPMLKLHICAHNAMFPSCIQHLRLVRATQVKLQNSIAVMRSRCKSIRNKESDYLSIIFTKVKWLYTHRMLKCAL